MNSLTLCIKSVSVSVLLCLLLPTSGLGNKPCNLQCLNGSHCRRMHGDATELQGIMQSGRLIEFCDNCPPEFTGVACDIEVDSNCDDCDVCHTAYLVSPFAGYMCQKAATEYCSPFEPASTLSFCTNGGKCRSNYFVDDPSDPFGNRLRDGHDGCRCPTEFSGGPHCEFLTAGTPKLQAAATDRSKSSAFNSIWIVTLALVGVVLVSTLMVMRYRRRRRIMLSSIYRTTDELAMSYPNDINYIVNQHPEEQEEMVFMTDSSPSVI